ncbi:MAG: anthranilate synthase component I family protein [Myxococcota bacterium]
MRIENLGAWSEAQWIDVALRMVSLPGAAWLDGDGSSDLGATSWLAAEPVEVVRSKRSLEALRSLRTPGGSDDVPHWIGYIAYDAGVTSRHARPGDAMYFARYDALLRRDAEGNVQAFAEDETALTRLRRRMESSRPALRAPSIHALRVTPADAHADAIERARAYIAAGDIYQVNLARCWDAAFEGSPLALCLAMREASPVPLGLYLDGFDHQVCARTMERFVRWAPDAEGRGPVETRPIKGTVRREGNDDVESDALRSDPKERAEHAMIVDLMRNDLGRLAEVGSVEVVRPLDVEPYAKLHHLVTTVRATTRPGTTLEDVVAATFPPGSVTGAPKLRAIEIIDELEESARGVYCGAIGFVDRSGGANFAVAIRTAVVRDQRVRYFAGGGLVWPSVAAKEVAETELKARVFLDALERIG